MALITYLTRIHFADGVLEEALRSEMEQQGKRRPMVIAEQAHLEGGIGERFYSGLPIRTGFRLFTDVPRLVTEDAAERVAAEFRDGRCDLLIAFGGNRAIDLAKVARVAIAHEEPVGQLSSEEGGAHRIGENLPDLFAVPNIGGFSSAVSDYARVKLNTGEQALLSSRRLIPTVTICDPTVTLGSSPVESASAAAGVISRRRSVIVALK